MNHYNREHHHRACRMSKRESNVSRREGIKKFADFIEEVFGQETNLTKEDVLERLKSVNSVYSFTRVMRFLRKQGRVLR